MAKSVFRVRAPFEFQGQAYQEGDSFDVPKGWERDTAFEAETGREVAFNYTVEVRGRRDARGNPTIVHETRRIILPLE